MLLCNLSSDAVYLFDGHNEAWLERNGIEKTLGAALIEWYEKSPYQEVFLVNGPGGFTNLRVGALTWNLLAQLLHLRGISISFFSCTKIDLYRFFVKKGILPSIGYIYLGQKHAVWRYDFDSDSYELVRQPFVFEKDSFCDVLYDGSYWGDLVDMVCFGIDSDGLFLSWKGINHRFIPEDIGLKLISTVSPEYLIDPV